jgi:hypothetical protein
MSVAVFPTPLSKEVVEYLKDANKVDWRKQAKTTAQILQRPIGTVLALRLDKDLKGIEHTKEEEQEAIRKAWNAEYWVPLSIIESRDAELAKQLKEVYEKIAVGRAESMVANKDARGQLMNAMQHLRGVVSELEDGGK